MKQRYRIILEQLLEEPLPGKANLNDLGQGAKTVARAIGSGIHKALSTASGAANSGVERLTGHRFDKSTAPVTRSQPSQSQFKNATDRLRSSLSNRTSGGPGRSPTGPAKSKEPTQTDRVGAKINLARGLNTIQNKPGPQNPTVRAHVARVRAAAVDRQQAARTGKTQDDRSTAKSYSGKGPGRSPVGGNRLSGGTTATKSSNNPPTPRMRPAAPMSGGTTAKNSINNPPTPRMRPQSVGAKPATSGYRIQRGDTLSSIAKSRGTTVAALMKANPNIKNANRIRAGDSLNF
ncbi:MAG: LysM domain-containing protein [Candidatus Paceibacterota bacterium]